MNNIFKVIICVLAFNLSFLVSAQREVIIEPDTLAILNNTINGDTLDNGERVDLNTVYILRRNAVYKTNASIANAGYKLTIRAENGSGSMPIIQPTPIRGGDAFRPFNISDDLELDGLYVTNIDDTGGILTRIIRVNTAATVRLRNCWFDGTSQSVVRFDSPGSSVFFENCIISHVGETFDTGNGRIVDVRGVGGISADSIVFRNNTIFNISRRLVRHSNTLSTNYLEISNNTLVNSLVQIGSFEQSREVKIVNNLFVNPNLEGDTRSANLFQIDEYTVEDIYIDAGIDPTRRIETSHNWFYYDPKIVDIWNDTQIWNDTIPGPDIYDSDMFRDLVDLNGDFFNDTTAAENATMTEPYVFEGPIEFRNAPRPSNAIIIGVINDGLTAPSRDDGTAPNWNYATSPFFRVIQGTLTFPWDFPYDFTYDLSSAAATAATDGGPIGSNQWPPGVIEDVVVGKEDRFDRNASVYPNPFAAYIKVVDYTNVESIGIYDLSGTEMIRLESLTTDLINVSSFEAGVYIVQIESANGQFSTQRIIKKQ